MSRYPTAKCKDARPWRHLYNTKQWKALRLHQLSIEPLCKFCQQQGNVTAAGVADHIEPHKGNRELFFAPSNLQSLCKTCHDSAKQRAESRGVKEIGADTEGAPLDPTHHWHTGGGR